MIRFSTKSQYGLRAMTYLAKNPRRILSLKEISKKEGISFDYLEKILSKLEKAKLIRAKKGARGGYFLVKSASKIKTGDIIRTLEGRTILVKCLPRGCYCPREKKCLTKSFWGKIQKTLDSALNSITLADLIRK